MKVYGPREAAEVLNVNPETIRRWARAGKLSGALVSRQTGWIFTEEDLREFLDKHRPHGIPEYRRIQLEGLRNTPLAEQTEVEQ